MALWLAYQFPVDTEAVQATNQELLDIYLQQHLPKYYQSVIETPTAFFAEPTANQYLNTLPSGALVNTLDSAAIFDISQLR
ncbi:MAG: hypothetical protein WBA23_15780 [Tunicatimonas sp.]|uniref:hypothetical protein n=1 Tax=Tunicatimonas sp. TaxID=1940096 RepID=UPI003C70BE81